MRNIALNAIRVSFIEILSYLRNWKLLFLELEPFLEPGVSFQVHSRTWQMTNVMRWTCIASQFVAVRFNASTFVCVCMCVCGEFLSWIHCEMLTFEQIIVKGRGETRYDCIGSCENVCWTWVFVCYLSQSLVCEAAVQSQAVPWLLGAVAGFVPQRPGFHPSTFYGDLSGTETSFCSSTSVLPQSGSFSQRSPHIHMSQMLCTPLCNRRSFQGR